MKGKEFTVTAQRVINLGNYRSLHLGGSITTELGPEDDAIKCFASAQRQLLNDINDRADAIEDQIHK
jgi:hypothetical protein